MNSNSTSAELVAARGNDRTIIEILARIGYVAKGVIYASVGILSISTLFGWLGGGEVTGTRGAVQAISEQAFGNFLLLALIAGLAGYVVWRFTQGIADTEDKGDDAAGWVQRIGFMISGWMYAALGFYAMTLLGWIPIGSASGGGTKKELTAQLMSHEWGIWLVAIAGVVFILVGLYQGYRAVSGKFMNNWKTHRLSESQQRVAKRAAQLGIGVRAVTFLIIGSLIVQASRNANPEQAEGLGQALRTLHAQPYGPYLLGITAFGLVCYGLYCFINARYRTLMRG